VNIDSYMFDLGVQARAASQSMAMATRGDKDTALNAIAQSLESSVVELVAANAKDLAAGEKNGGCYFYCTSRALTWCIE